MFLVIYLKISFFLGKKLNTKKGQNIFTIGHTMYDLDAKYTRCKTNSIVVLLII